MSESTPSAARRRVLTGITGHLGPKRGRSLPTRAGVKAVPGVAIDRDEAGLPFWSLFDDSRVPMALLDQGLRFVALNHAMAGLLGYSREALLGTQGDRLAAESQPAAAAGDREALRRGRLYAERNVLHADGTVLRVEFAAHSIQLGGQDLLLFVIGSARSEADGW